MTGGATKHTVSRRVTSAVACARRKHTVLGPVVKGSAGQDIPGSPFRLKARFRTHFGLH